MQKRFSKNNHYFIFLLISILILICYSRTFNAPWQLDDPPNILENFPLHIDNLLPETLYRTLFAKPFAEEQLYRPVANLSFALNWYFGQDNSFGYHLVNLLVHILTAAFLYKTTLLLLRSSSFKKHPEQDILFIALLSAVLWAINPIQTQAVTYIVQRMASMAAMFFVFSLYSYICARHAERCAQRARNLLACSLFFLLAMGCKENVVTLIPSLLLIELLFFETKDRFSQAIRAVLVAANIVFILAAVYYLVSHDYLHALTTPIGSRPFSLLERLLTQPSILLFYLSLLLYPSPDRLSIDHSFPLSTSLLHPWTTLPALLGLIALLVFAVLQRRKTPLLSFALLFFFINHLVESTIIPLELIFEHRNYLPSFFLFLPIAAGIHWAIKRSASSSRLVHGALIGLIPLLLIAIGLGTYIRNQTWATEESLWADALTKAPNNARPYAKLGEIYGWQKEKTPENLQTAVALLHNALERESPRTSFKAAIVDNIGKVYANYGLLDQAVKYYNQSLELNPDFINSRFDLAEALTLQGNFAQALEQIDKVITQNDLQSRFFNLKTMLLLRLGRPQEAAECSHEAMQRTFVNKERYFYNTGVALTKAGHLSQGMWFLRRAAQHFPDDRRVLCSLVENRIMADDAILAKKYITQLLAGQNITTLKQDLGELRHDYSTVPVNIDLISPKIFAATQEIVSNLEQTSPINDHESNK
ncbi:MAG: tetratricopeptide repeat protein [Desulfobulbus sp.]|nr:tetratricopeptide repeat protein [Desulfobulbus sp.]